MTFTCILTFKDWLQQASSFELRAVDRSVFSHFSPGPAPSAPRSLSDDLRRHRSPSRHPARGCVSFFFVLRDEYLNQ